jgi:hypothetical protein
MAPTLSDIKSISQLPPSETSNLQSEASRARHLTRFSISMNASGTAQCHLIGKHLKVQKLKAKNNSEEKKKTIGNKNQHR